MFRTAVRWLLCKLVAFLLNAVSQVCYTGSATERWNAKISSADYFQTIMAYSLRYSRTTKNRRLPVVAG